MCVKWCLPDALTYVEREEDEETGEVVERVIEKKLGRVREAKQGYNPLLALSPTQLEEED